MAMNEYFIGYRTFAALDARGTDEQESRHEATLRSEFTMLVPSAGRLLVAELVLQRHHTESGCKLEYYLVLPPQASLDFTAVERSGGGKDVEDFKQDVLNVTTECANVKTRLVLAQNPALTHADLQQDSQSMLDLKILRGLIRRRKRSVIMPTQSGDLVLDLPRAPVKLPIGKTCHVHARVSSLLPGHGISLREVHWVSSAVCPEDPSVPFPDAVNASRQGLAEEDLVRLVNSMDERGRAHLRISFEFAWADGSVSAMKILETVPG